MNHADPVLGRVLRSSTTGYTFGFSQAHTQPPAFGALVKTAVGDSHVFGLVYDQRVMDDALVRQIVASSDSLSEERIQDMRMRRQTPIEISVLSIGYEQGGTIYQLLPPHPPDALQPIFACTPDESRRVLTSFQYFRTVLDNMECPSEELLVASIRHGAGCQPPGQAQPYLIGAGRELTRLLAHDHQRLDAILRRLADFFNATHSLPEVPYG